jgi:hypothetical protein
MGCGPIFGGPPMQFVQPPPMQVMQPAPPRFPSPVQTAPLANAALPAAPAAQPPPRAIRGQMPDEPASRQPSPIRVPSPEQLGIAAPNPATANAEWTGRLQQLGVSSFHFVNLPGGAWQVICLVPGHQPGHHQRVEAEATTPAEAVRLVLSKVEQTARK